MFVFNNQRSTWWLADHCEGVFHVGVDHPLDDGVVDDGVVDAECIRNRLLSYPPLFCDEDLADHRVGVLHSAPPVTNRTATAHRATDSQASALKNHYCGGRSRLDAGGFPTVPIRDLMCHFVSCSAGGAESEFRKTSF